MAIYYTILIPVCRAYQFFLLWHTAFKNGSNEGIPNDLFQLKYCNGEIG